MSLRRIRPRMLDVVVTLVCAVLVATPFFATSSAVERPQVESGTSVDQRVLGTGLISHPLNGSFDIRSSGVSTGSVQWDLYSTADDGIKLFVTASRDPAMRDSASGANVPDHGRSPSKWTLGPEGRAFGFTATGTGVLDRFGDGGKWRGFEGRRAVEVARRTSGPVAVTRTTVRLRTEFDDRLASSARPTATVTATAVGHL